MSTYQEGVESPYVFQGIASFENAFAKMEKDLKASGPWLLGHNMSLADINMMPFVARLDYLDLLDVWIADRPATQAWWSRSQELPSYRAAISDHLPAGDIDAMKTFGGRIADRVLFHRSQYLLLPKANA